MSKVSEQDVVSFLKEKVASLKQELKKAEDGLAFFTGSSSAAPAKKRGPKSKVAKLADTVVEKAKKVSKKVAASVKPIDVPAEFADSLKRDAKIVYVLNSLKSGNAEEVTDELLKLEPGQEKEKLHRLVTQRLSALSLKGNLKSVKQGRKSSYSIK